ncbi:MAG: BON domain-containing protein [Acidobacteriaceae bacterium]|nr:BON domain-containing protein [Acidobacteriaceae bacterium]MBV9767345.1 BON domain-containing protein [Acidobacteriaceae bacterium]
MRRLIAFLFALPLIVGMLALPVQAGNSSRTSTAQRTVTATDSQIEATIRTKLAKSKIGKDGFRFHVQRGVVTWEGTTNVVQHKGSATRMAKAAGAVQVINKIQVSADGKAKASSNLKKAYVQQ